MKRAQPLFQVRYLLISTLTLLCLSLFPLAARAQQDPKCQPWIGIKSWDVHVHISGSGTSTSSGVYTMSFQESDDIDIQLAVDPSSAAAGTSCNGMWAWTYVQQSQSNVHSSVSYSDNVCQLNMSASRLNGPSPGYLAGDGLIGMDFEKGTYFASAVAGGSTGLWDSQSSNGLCLEFAELQSLGSGYPFVGSGPDTGASCPGYDPTQSGPIVGALPGSGGLSGSVSYSCPAEALGSGGAPGNALDLFSWTITWSMTPTPANLGLVLTIPTYDTWRPTAGRNEKDVGNQPGKNATNGLGIRAQLMDKDTGMPSYLTPDKVTFTLADVSREPGVAMNWPPQGTATTDPDLTFDCEFNFAEGTVKVDGKDCLKDFTVTGTQVEIDPEDNSKPVLATLSPHDWGGWGTVNVTATVAGVAYQGSLDTDPGNTNILIPKRQSGSFVADSWKTGRVALGTADSDDSENDPKGDGQAGDGFTLYEEYRGFYMGCSDNGGFPQAEGTAGATCQHAEGDPKKKDYFIVDNIGADQGIKMFQAASGLNVHFQGLKAEEIGPAGSGSYRVTNFNHSNGAHEVDQHAVVINWGGNGASQVVTPSDYVCPQDGSHTCPALPRHIDHIEISSKLVGAPAENFAVDVAHELSHSVDVYHHGDVDHAEFWTIDPQTKTAKAVLSLGAFSVAVPITIVLETANLASPDPADLADMSRLALDQPLQNNPPKDQQGNSIPGRFVYVGNTVCHGAVMLHGQHSGDENSIMRYDYAQAYIPNGFPNIRIWIGPGAEASGTTLTDHPEGTGVNDPNREIPP